MNWYYVDAGQQAGPVDDAQLEQLRASGRIQPDTLIWCDGMVNWQAYSEVRPAGVGMAAGAPPPPGPAPASAYTGNQAVCSECGGVFNVSDMISHAGVYVCANCKPIFMQRLAEGARLNTGRLNFAGFWTRFAAVFLDGLIMGAINMGIGFIGGLVIATGARNDPGAMLIFQFVLMAVEIAIALSYETVMIGRYGATLGKMACKIKVVTAEGGRVTYGRAIGRYFAKMLSGLLCAAGYIMAGFDEEKRALHDRICNTRVILNS